jgi:hypothetical protein
MSDDMHVGDEVEMWRDGKKANVGIVQHVFDDGKAWISPALQSDYHCPHVQRHVIELGDTDA